MIAKTDIIIVTVTYGDRWQLLSKSIKSCILQGIESFIIIGNAVKYDFQEMIKEEYSNQDNISFNFVNNNKNMGSAYGYKTGLTEAMKSDKKYIMIIDDDAQLLPNCINTLISAYEEIIRQYSEQNLVVSALRIEHDSDIKERILENGLKRKSAFRRFHLLELPRRILYRYGIFQFKPEVTCKDKYKIPYTLYSGIFFNKIVLDKYGLPDTSFILYGDDLEFTYRITSGGGDIFLIPSAQISDLQMSWWCRKSFGNPFDALILGGTDKLVYYAFRNEIYFEKYCLKKSGILYFFHKYLYIFILFLNSLRLRQFNRFRVIIDALIDGNKGKLGLNERFPLE